MNNQNQIKVDSEDTMHVHTVNFQQKQKIYSEMTQESIKTQFAVKN